MRHTVRVRWQFQRHFERTGSNVKLVVECKSIVAIVRNLLGSVASDPGVLRS